jgi:hypothetical protein
MKEFSGLQTMLHEDAVEAAQRHAAGGWRLPTIEELSRKNPAHKTVWLAGGTGGPPHAPRARYAPVSWFVGNQRVGSRSTSLTAGVILVRDRPWWRIAIDRLARRPVLWR